MGRNTCCKGCTARRITCHNWGECVHYMTERAAIDMQNEQMQIKRAGNYGYTDSLAVSWKLRRKEKVRSKR